MATVAPSLGCVHSNPAPLCRPIPSFGPWTREEVLDAKVPTLAKGGRPAGFADALIAFYQRHMRAHHLPGQGCKMWPSCSVYGRLALRRYGLLGLVLIADRLFVREHVGMAASYLPVCAKGQPGEIVYDPVP